MLHKFILLVATQIILLNAFEDVHRSGHRSELYKERPHIQKSLLQGPQTHATSVGRSFVFSFLNSHLSQNDTSYTENLNVILTNPGSQDAQVSLASPSALFTNQTTTVPAMSTKVIKVPAEMQTDYMDVYFGYGVIENKTIFVDSSQPILVVLSNAHSDKGSEDKYTVRPICTLGTDYRIFGDEAADLQSQLQSTNIYTIIAVQDGTNVLTDPIKANVTLNRGQQLTIAIYYWLTNVQVQSTKPVAVFAGAVCGFGYYNPQICSHEALMLGPTSNWHTHFPYYKFQPTGVGEFMALILNDNTDVYRDGVLIFSNLTANHYVIFRTYSGAYVETSNPTYGVAVGASDLNGYGAPFFAHLPNEKNFVTDPVTFSVGAVDDDIGLTHNIRLVTKLYNIGNILIQGPNNYNYIPHGLLYIRMGLSTYYFVDIRVDPGLYTVSTTAGTMNYSVTVYGWGLFREYAFTPTYNLIDDGTC